MGEGPGEFRNVWSLDLLAGDTLVVGEYRPARIVRWSSRDPAVRAEDGSRWSGQDLGATMNQQEDRHVERYAGGARLLVPPGLRE